MFLEKQEREKEEYLRQQEEAKRARDEANREKDAGSKMVDQCVETTSQANDAVIQTDTFARDEATMAEADRHKHLSPEEEARLREEEAQKERERKRKNKKAEEDHYFGQKSFEIMQSLDRDQLKQFLPLVAKSRVESPEKDWVQEYMKFLDESKEQRMKKFKVYRKDRNGNDVIDITETLKLQKEEEWWQRVRLMLMSLVRQKYMPKIKNKRAKRTLQTTVHKKNRVMNKLAHKAIELSEEALANDGMVHAKIGTMDSDSEDLDFFKDFSCNTGPDIMFMLNQIKVDTFGKRNRDLSGTRSVSPPVNIKYQNQEIVLPKQKRFKKDIPELTTTIPEITDPEKSRAMDRLRLLDNVSQSLQTPEGKKDSF